MAKGDPIAAAGSRGGPPSPNAAFLVMALGREIRAEVEAALRRHALTLRHVSALGHLSGCPGLSYSELARRAGVSPQSMQATLGQLERLGAVERRTVPGRGRTAELHLTQNGDRLLALAQRAIDGANHRLLGDLTPGQDRQLTSLLFQVFTARVRREPPDPGG